MDNIFLIAVFLFGVFGFIRIFVEIGDALQIFENPTPETTRIKSETKEYEITPEMQKMYENQSLAWCREQMMKQETNYD